MRRPRLLVVDDQDRTIELAHALMRDYDYATRCELPGPCWSCTKRPGCTLTHAHDLAEAELALSKQPEVDAVLLDLAFDLDERRLAPLRPGSPPRRLAARRARQGLDILHALRRTRPTLPVVLMTTRAAIDYADDADALAADEYVTLAGADAFDVAALSLLIERTLARRAVPGDDDASFVWGEGTEMGRLRRDALALAQTSLPLLVLGETGTGKTRLAAEVLHPASGREGAFVSVDLSSLPEGLIAAELFGSARGAFSGAVDRAGALEAAHGGTLFIDEIGNLTLEAQRVLLVAMERGEVVRLGETRQRPVDVRLVAATNVDLEAAVRAGRFRADLLSRLNPSVRITLPPLRERRRDLPTLIEHFVQRAFERPGDRALLQRYGALRGLDEPLRVEVQIDLKASRPPGRPSRALAADRLRFMIGRDTWRELEAHVWPGNLRELRHVTTSMALLTLADATALGRRAGTGDGKLLPVSRRMVRTLLGASTPEVAVQEGQVPPQKRLHTVALWLERVHYQRLFTETGGDFAAMAGKLLGQRSVAAARRVRLRYNQLGLRVGRRDS